MLDFLARVIASLARRMRHVIVLMHARKNSRESIKRRQGNNILVICYGNIYRSPLAEYLLKKSCPPKMFNIDSAGFHRKENRPCDPEYLKLLEEHGYDLSEHRSRLIMSSDISWADIILIMDRYNWDMLKTMDENCIRKTVWIGALSNKKRVEVDDPYGKGYTFTKGIIGDIEVCIQDICLELSKPRI
ncbi:MAG: hypothetical protein AB2792_11155 [Candidatus Thiodiazotropha sp.]